jgi:ribosomal protein L21E
VGVSVPLPGHGVVDADPLPLLCDPFAQGFNVSGYHITIPDICGLCCNDSSILPLHINASDIDANISAICGICCCCADSPAPVALPLDGPLDDLPIPHINESLGKCCCWCEAPTNLSDVYQHVFDDVDYDNNDDGWLGDGSLWDVFGNDSCCCCDCNASVAIVIPSIPPFSTPYINFTIPTFTLPNLTFPTLYSTPSTATAPTNGPGRALVCHILHFIGITAELLQLVVQFILNVIALLLNVDISQFVDISIYNISASNQPYESQHGRRGVVIGAALAYSVIVDASKVYDVVVSMQNMVSYNTLAAQLSSNPQLSSISGIEAGGQPTVSTSSDNGSASANTKLVVGLVVGIGGAMIAVAVVLALMAMRNGRRTASYSPNDDHLHDDPGTIV